MNAKYVLLILTLVSILGLFACRSEIAPALEPAPAVTGEQDVVKEGEEVAPTEKSEVQVTIVIPEEKDTVKEKEEPQQFSTFQAWLKGQLHLQTHTLGKEATLELCRNNGYGFFAVSDHGSYTARSDYGEMIQLSGMEQEMITPIDMHLLAIGAESKPQSKDARDFVIETWELGGLPVLAHPWDKKYYAAFAEAVKGLSGTVLVEVSNRRTQWEDPWEYLLSNTDLRVWAIAVDDYQYEPEDKLDLGYVMLAGELSHESIMNSLRDGRFYASSGAHVELSVSESGDEFLVKTEVPSNIYWKISGGRVVQIEKGVKKSRFLALGEEGYVRALIVESDNQGHKAWMQPYFIE